MTVKDLTASTAWYTGVLGFEVTQQREREGKVHAVSFRSGVMTMLLNQDDGAKGFDRVKGVGLSLYITTQENIDEIAARATSNGATLDVEPRDMPWGVRMISLRDPDGYKLVIAKPIA
jgi:uncharacterized glyoxalase superfamily protein PhnB